MACGRRRCAAESRMPPRTPRGPPTALYVLIVLNRLMEARYGLSAAGRRDFALLFGDPWFLVKTLLGHADVETTKRHYLVPVTHLYLESILAAAEADGPGREAEDLDGVFARLARETAGIQDIDAVAGARPAGKR